MAVCNLVLRQVLYKTETVLTYSATSEDIFIMTHCKFDLAMQLLWSECVDSLTNVSKPWMDTSGSH